MNKNILTLLAVAALAVTTASAQSRFATITPISATLVPGNAAASSNNPTAGNILTLSAVPGGTSAVEVQFTVHTTASNAVVAASADFRLSNDGVLYSDALTTASVTHAVGTNSVVLSRIACNGARFAKLIAYRNTGTNSATVTVSASQHR